jgi:DNA replication and repair protein RecF
MSLIIDSVKLCEFRSYQQLDLSIEKDVVIIVGPNAKGKTNIIEALQLVTMLESFRNPAWNDICRRGTDASSVIIESHWQRDIELKLFIENNNRQYFLNDKKKNKSDLYGLMPSVLFIPDDLLIIKSSAGARRQLIDTLGSQMSKTYVSICQDYNKIVKQKNNLLKEDYCDKNCLESWNNSLVNVGIQLYNHRRRLFIKLVDAASVIYAGISGGEQLKAEYVPTWRDVAGGCDGGEMDETTLFSEALVVAFEEERRRMTALIGPHRDDIVFYIDGLDARHFASQGQQRSLVLALKIAEVELLKEIMGYSPVLLLDDVMSELDERRRFAIIDIVREKTQAFITTTNLDYFNRDILDESQIVRL